MTRHNQEALNADLKTRFEQVDQTAQEYEYAPKPKEVGTVEYVGAGIVRVKGLYGVMADEVLRFPDNVQGLAFNVDPDGIGGVLLDEGESLAAGSEVNRTGRVLDIPVGEALIGRVLDPLARPLDNGPAIRSERRLPVERPAWGIMDRSPVTVPLQTGLKVVDALIPIGRGQRELILGDRQTGKTAIALDTIINQKDQDIVCIYCGIGKRGAAVAKVIADLEEYGATDYSTVILATEEDPPGLQFVAPYAAFTLGEYFMEQGRDVLVVLDDLTRHARAYRELSLLLRRPPGREAYPGDIFYIHSRLLERSTHLKKTHGGGSLTALPIIETEAQNISAYIPTNLISITDGQIYLSPDLFQKGNLPAVDVGESVSRVGGKTQLSAYRLVASDLRLSYSQFEELESFARFGTRLDEETRKTLERGRRVREIFKQPQYAPLPVCEQIAALVAVNNGLLDPLPAEKVPEASQKAQNAVRDQHGDICEKIESGEELSESEIKRMIETARTALNAIQAASQAENRDMATPETDSEEQG